MIPIFSYLFNYFLSINKKLLFISTLFTSFAIFVNYYFNVNQRIIEQPQALAFICWYLIFLVSFLFPYLLFCLLSNKSLFNNKKLAFLLFVAPLIFAYKMSVDYSFYLSSNAGENVYWNQVLYWPLKLITITAFLYLIWRWLYSDQPFFGTGSFNFKAAPYFLMLLIMVPFIAFASTQADFLHTYPKLKHIPLLTIHSPYSALYKILFEISYGSDFLTIELFFRGFLIIAFSKWFGKDCILPMACFYCTIHFGKPLAECISSFFGGLILGIITYNTRTIWGGVIVHLGIAWLMEIGGYLGNKWM
jgi:hypothetical protein